MVELLSTGGAFGAAAEVAEAGACRGAAFMSCLSCI